ncbi:MAG: hypothetical protein HY663_02295 [Chloroflexi bacterium]|nr:hypothetical protein [Chloroflexota bacterium]
MATSNRDNASPGDPPLGDRNALHPEDYPSPVDQAPDMGRFFREFNPLNFQAAACLFLAVDTGFSLRLTALKGIALGALGVGEFFKLMRKGEDLRGLELTPEEQEERERRDEERRKEFERQLDRATRTDDLVRELGKEQDPEEQERRDEETLKDNEKFWDEWGKEHPSELSRLLEEEQSNQQKRDQ